MRFIPLLILFFSVQICSGQFFNKENWKENRHQLEMGLGFSNFLGDLGGKDDIGTDDLQDLEKTEFNFGGYIGYKWAIYRKFYLRTNFSYARVTGDDKLTLEPFRHNRNLHFRSDLFELAAMLEYEIVINFRKGHIYDIKGVKGWKAGGSSIFLFAGLGGFHYNPKANVGGDWIALRPLRTEGQGLEGGAKEYGRFSVSIPLGISVTKRMDNKWSLGVELSYRYTFTDYIDDVSTVYYNPEDLILFHEGPTGDLAAYLSNPSLGVAQDGLGNFVTAPGMQRGDETDDDGWMLLTIRSQYLLGDYGYKTGYKKIKHKRRIRNKKRLHF